MHTHYAGGCFRLWTSKRKVLELSAGWGFSLSISFPTAWHAERNIVLSMTLIWGKVFIHLPWFGDLYPDYGQCEGPRYGFAFHSGRFWIYTGQSTDKEKAWIAIRMPWDWGSATSSDIGDFQRYVGREYAYRYFLKSGEAQHRIATITEVKNQTWRRWWIPWKRSVDLIWVEFDEEIGEGTGSWKGGTVGCGYEIREYETPINALMRMERTREFR